MEGQLILLLLLHSCHGAPLANPDIPDPNIRFWPNGEVPYRFHHAFNNPELREAMIEAMANITNQVPCVRFINLEDTPDRNDRDWILIRQGPRCDSEVGRVNYQQDIYINCPAAELTAVIMKSLGKPIQTEGPLSVIDQVELAMAYSCEENLSKNLLIRYNTMLTDQKMAALTAALATKDQKMAALAATLTAALDTKASTTALNQLTSTVTALTTNMNSKASTTALNQLTSNMDSKASTTALNQLSSNVNSKASTTALNQLSSKVDSKASSTALEAVKRKQALHSAHCGYQGGMGSTGQITYDKLVTNVAGGTNTSMDPASGTWTAGMPGTYLVTWDLFSYPTPGKYNQLYLYQNGGVVSESEHRSYISSGTHGSTGEQGGRSLVLSLVRGDRLWLQAVTMDGNVHFITFCVTLLHAE